MKEIWCKKRKREGETRSDCPWRPPAINRPIGVSIQYAPLVADVSRRNGQWVWRSIGDRARYPSRIPIPNSLLPNPNLPFIGSCRRRRTTRRAAPVASYLPSISPDPFQVRARRPHPPLPSPPFRRGRLALRLFAATALPPPRLIHSESGLLA